MKSPAERGPVGAWAYEARADADLSVEEVAERLARKGQPIQASTLRGIEGGSKQPSRRLLKALAEVYGKPPPGESGAGADTGDTQSVPAAYLDALAPLLQRLDRQAEAISQLAEAVRSLTNSPVTPDEKARVLAVAGEGERESPRPLRPRLRGPRSTVGGPRRRSPANASTEARP